MKKKLIRNLIRKKCIQEHSLPFLATLVGKTDIISGNLEKFLVEEAKVGEVVKVLDCDLLDKVKIVDPQAGRATVVVDPVSGRD